MKNERLFQHFSEGAEPTEEGRMQFVEHQSRGIKPDNPDPYFTRLSQGKKAFDLLSNEYRDLYFGDSWWGFVQLWRDWEGNRWVLPHLFKWYPRPLPAWLGVECDDKKRHEMEREDIITERR